MHDPHDRDRYVSILVFVELALEYWLQLITPADLIVSILVFVELALECRQQIT